MSTEHLQVIAPIRQLRIYCAGVWHNFIIVLLALLALVLLPMALIPFYTTGNSVVVSYIVQVSTIPWEILKLSLSNANPSFCFPYEFLLICKESAVIFIFFFLTASTLLFLSVAKCAWVFSLFFFFNYFYFLQIIILCNMSHITFAQQIASGFTLFGLLSWGKRVTFEPALHWNSTINLSAQCRVQFYCYGNINFRCWNRGFFMIFCNRILV